MNKPQNGIKERHYYECHPELAVEGLPRGKAGPLRSEASEPRFQRGSGSYEKQNRC